MTEGNRAGALAALRAEALGGPAGPGLVFGRGNPNARLMIVGEAPGEQEVRQGQPFVGQAGKLLDRLLADAGIDRSEGWVTNVVKHRPTAGLGGSVVNRPPRADEIAADLPWLEREIEVVRPRVILALGNLAARTLIHSRFKMGAEHGRWFPGRFGSQVLATYHPAYVLRRTGQDREEVLRLVRQDLARVGDVLHRAWQEGRQPS
ncbi:MAG: uracil-DNA glycosylase [Chloroflexi bacterium]|nr:uracil-DNA glycosylase [Chloroflexota bacterium]